MFASSTPSTPGGPVLKITCFGSTESTLVSSPPRGPDHHFHTSDIIDSSEGENTLPSSTDVPQHLPRAQKAHSQLSPDHAPPQPTQGLSKHAQVRIHRAARPRPSNELTMTPGLTGTSSPRRASPSAPACWPGAPSGSIFPTRPRTGTACGRRKRTGPSWKSMRQKWSSSTSHRSGEAHTVAISSHGA